MQMWASLIFWHGINICLFLDHVGVLLDLLLQDLVRILQPLDTLFDFLITLRHLVEL